MNNNDNWEDRWLPDGRWDLPEPAPQKKKPKKKLSRTDRKNGQGSKEATSPSLLDDMFGPLHKPDTVTPEKTLAQKIAANLDFFG